MRAQAAMALTGEQRAELLAVAEAMVARLAAMFATHRALLQDLRELPFAASGIHPQSAAVCAPVLPLPLAGCDVRALAAA